MSKTHGHIKVSYVSLDEGVPGDLSHDEISTELSTVIAEAVTAWYAVRGRDLLAFEPWTMDDQNGCGL